MRNYITQDALLEDLTEILGEFVNWLGNVFCVAEPGKTDMKFRPTEPVQVVSGPALQSGSDDNMPLDISRLPITDVLRHVRSYAYDGQRPESDQDLLNDVINAQEFLFALKAADESAETHDLVNVDADVLIPEDLAALIDLRIIAPSGGQCFDQGDRVGNRS